MSRNINQFTGSRKNHHVKLEIYISNNVIIRGYLVIQFQDLPEKVDMQPVVNEEVLR